MVVVFLPFSDFEKSVSSLDDRRLGKQRIEALAILKSIKTKSSWYNHPSTKMWIGFKNALKQYFNLCIEEWERRGFNNSLKKIKIKGEIKLPWFFLIFFFIF
jgi:hypothetical protein